MTQNFVRYGLKKLICTGYHKGDKGMEYVLEGDTDIFNCVMLCAHHNRMKGNR